MADMTIVKSEVANALTSAAANHVVAVAQDIFDQAKQKYQSELNAGLESRIAILEAAGNQPSEGGGGGSIDRPKTDNNNRGVLTVTADTEMTALDAPDMIYIFKDNYQLGNNWFVPDNCILKFEGGAIEGTYQITGSDTVIDAPLDYIFDKRLIIKGTWVVDSWKPEWFWNKAIEPYINSWDGGLATYSANHKINAFQKCMDTAGGTMIPMELTAKRYNIYNFPRTCPTTSNPEPEDHYNPIFYLVNNLTIFSDVKSEVYVIGIDEARGQGYVAVFGHMYAGRSKYPINTRWNNIHFRGIVINNMNDTMTEPPYSAYPNESDDEWIDKPKGWKGGYEHASSCVINKYGVYAYCISNFSMIDCEVLCGGSNCLYFDVPYGGRSGSVSEIHGNADNCLLRNTYFRIKEKEWCYDLSGLFIAVENTEIDSCVIEHHKWDEYSDKWGCGGCEIHAGNFFIHDCTFIGFNNGLNDCNYVGEQHGYHLIINNKFDRCGTPEGLWSYGQDKGKSDLNKVRFIGNECIGCHSPFNVVTQAGRLYDVVIANNYFDLVPYTDSVVKIRALQHRTELHIENNVFKHFNPIPWIQFGGSAPVHSDEFSLIEWKDNKFIDCWNYSITETKKRVYRHIYTGGATFPNTIFRWINNTYEINDVTVPPTFFDEDNPSQFKEFTVKGIQFTEGASVLTGAKLTTNNLTAPISDIFPEELQRFIPYTDPGVEWWEGTTKYRGAVKAPACKHPKLKSGVNYPVTIHYCIPDNYKYWYLTCNEASDLKLFQIGDSVNLNKTESGSLASRATVCAICGDKIFLSGCMSEAKSDWGPTMYIKLDYVAPFVVRTSDEGPTENRPSKPAAGCMYFDTTVEGYVVYDGVSWKSIGSGGGSGMYEYIRKYDAATMNLGEDYRTPTIDEFKELVTKAASIEHVSDYEGTGIDGCVFTFNVPISETETEPRSIFFQTGVYWSSSLSSNYLFGVVCNINNDGTIETKNGNKRNAGNLIRPVSDTDKGIDLGLSVRWTDENLTGRYSWGETQTKNDYSVENYYIPVEANWGNADDEVAQGGMNKAYPVSHIENTVKHITADERTRWNSIASTLENDVYTKPQMDEILHLSRKNININVDGTSITPSTIFKFFDFDVVAGNTYEITKTPGDCTLATYSEKIDDSKYSIESIITAQNYGKETQLWTAIHDASYLRFMVPKGKNITISILEIDGEIHSDLLNPKSYIDDGDSERFKKYNAAALFFGDNWTYPTIDHIKELINSEEVVIEYKEDYNGAKGNLVTNSGSGKTLFFPEGNYWTSSMANATYIQVFKSDSNGIYCEVEDVSTGNFNQLGNKRNGTALLKAISLDEDANGIDILNNGVKWSEFNVGSSSHEVTVRYCWGETKPYDPEVAYYLAETNFGKAADELYNAGDDRLDQEFLVMHKSNNDKHITAEERARWNNSMSVDNVYTKAQINEMVSNFDNKYCTNEYLDQIFEINPDKSNSFAFTTSQDPHIWKLYDFEFEAGKTYHIRKSKSDCVIASTNSRNTSDPKVQDFSKDSEGNYIPGFSGVWEGDVVATGDADYLAILTGAEERNRLEEFEIYEVKGDISEKYLLKEQAFNCQFETGVSDFNIDVDSATSTVIYYSTRESNVLNSPFNLGESVGVYATGYLVKLGSNWVQYAYRFTQGGTGTYARLKTPQGWGNWVSVDKKERFELNIADANIPYETLSQYKELTYVLRTGKDCDNLPWVKHGENDGYYAIGYLIYKGDDQWQMTLYRGTYEACATGVYTRYYYHQAWSKWIRIDNGYSNLGKINSLDIDLKSLETESAGFVIDNLTDLESSPWTTTNEDNELVDIKNGGTIIGTLKKVGNNWYQKVCRLSPENAGTYLREGNPDKLNLDPPVSPWGNWKKIDSGVDEGNLPGSFDNFVKTEDLSAYVKHTELSTVAKSGSYNDLTNKPTIPPMQILTQAQYDALENPDANTLYFIKG